MTIYARQTPRIHGGIGWCAYDYATPWSGPMAYHGVMDIMRIPKFAFYFYKSQSAADNYDGSKHPMVFIANYNTESSPLDRRVYSNCDSVRLYRNGTLVATQRPDTLFEVADSSLCYDAGWGKFCFTLPIREKNLLAHPAFTFKNVAFKAGELKAEGYIGGVVAATHIVKTPGTAKKIVLQADPPVIEANGSDFSRIVATVVDSNGTQVLSSGTAISFSMSPDNGKIIGDNPAPTEAGATIILAQASTHSGKFSISASAAGLASGSVDVTVTESTPVVMPSLKSSLRHAPNLLVKTITGTRFIIPGVEKGKARRISVFDLHGRLLYNDVTKSRVLDLRRKIGASPGVLVIKSQAVQ
jgi:beta-galactosidase